MSYVEISQQEYLKYKQNWVNKVPKDINAKFPSEHFQHEGKWLYGYKIHESLRSNFRTTSGKNPAFTKIVFRFVIDNKDKVALVLFGIDQISNDPLTLYYLLNEPILEKPIINLSFNKTIITPEEAEKWTTAWYDEINKLQDVRADLFHVFNATAENDARLQNYTFKFEEVNKLASLGIDKEVNVYFAINKHPDPRDSSISGRNLLRLVVEWDFQDTSRANSYYDISQPCPVCCPACP